MFRTKFFSLILLSIAAGFSMPQSAEAGPLLDWLLGRRCCRPHGCFRPAVPVTTASPCNTCQTTCMQTCQRTVVNYVPCTSYRTSWECVPVTSYRPQTQVDPCTGCSVTCMRPCTTYTYRAKQTPYTTYRPVYSTQTYQVPITYSTQMPQVPVAPTGGCNTCGVPGVAGVTSPTTVPSITGTINTGGSYTTVPANGVPTPAASTQPSLNPQVNQRPIIIEQPSVPSGSTSRLPVESNVTPVKDPQPLNQWHNNPPQLFTEEAKTAESPVYQRFNYTPVRFASTAEPGLKDAEINQPSQVVYYGSVTRSKQAQQPAASVTQPAAQELNQGWRSLSK